VNPVPALVHPNMNKSIRKLLILCSSSKNPYLPHGRSLETPRGRLCVSGVQIVKCVQRSRTDVSGREERGDWIRPLPQCPLIFSCSFACYIFGLCSTI